MDNNYNNYNNYNNGYDNNYNGGYNMTPEYQGGVPSEPEQKGAGLAIAAFVVSLINFLLCCSSLSIITVPLCLILAIVSLASHRKGKGLAITSIILSVFSGIIFGYFVAIYSKIMPDLIYFTEHADSIITEYEETGEIPERFEKYEDEKFDKYWSAMGYDSFEEFFADFIEGYDSESGTFSYSYSYSSTSAKEEDSSVTTTVPKDYDHSGETLVDLSV